jgi:peptidoglycan/xylan/chitin deacetylase (PgdA/CDA1 family)
MYTYLILGNFRGDEVRIFVFSGRKIILVMVIVMVSLLTYISNTRIIPSIAGTYFKVNTNQKVIALTFDDGPDSEFTGAILDILKQKQVKATFFVIGKNASQNPSLLRRIVKEGHEVENHGYSHSRGFQLSDELKQTDQSVFAVTGEHTHFYRPPGGYVTQSEIERIKDQGYTVTLWSVDSKDWKRPGVDQIVSNVVQKAFPGAIVLLHDGGGLRSQTVLALEKLIDQLNTEGYRFVTLSELQTFKDGTT